METNGGDLLAVAVPADIVGKLPPPQLPLPSLDIDVSAWVPLTMLSNEVTAAKRSFVQPLQRYPHPPNFYCVFTYIFN